MDGARVHTAALIGCGAIASRYDERPLGADDPRYTHAGMYTGLPKIALVAACDPDPVRLNACGRFWGIDRLFTDACSMVSDCRPDVVSVATPDGTHADIILALLDLPVPPRVIFVEKPLALDATTAWRVLRSCHDRNVVPVVNYVRRWDRNHAEAQAFVANGGLGTVLTATSYYVRGLRHNGCHAINMLKHLLGPIRAVAARPSPLGPGSFSDDPSLEVDLHFATGVMARLIPLDSSGYHFSLYEIDLFGSAGRIRFVDNGRALEAYGVTTDDSFPNFKRLVPASPTWSGSSYSDAMLRAGKALLDLLEGQACDPQQSARDAIDDLLVIEAAFASARSGGAPTPLHTPDSLEE